MEGLSYSEAAEWLRDHGNEIDFELFSDHILELLDDAEAEPLYNPRTKTIKQNTRRAIRESQLGGEYWKERGFYRDTIKFWNLRTRARNTYPYVIPFETSQEPNYYISRTGRANVFPKYLYQPGAPKSGLLFGAEHITGDVIVVCEGPLDCVAIWQAIKQRNAQSVYSPVAILGDYISIKQVKLLEEHAAQVILFLDNDDAGHRAIETFMKMKPPQLLTFVSDYSRTDAKDPGEMLPKEIIQAIGRSRLWVGE
jgi:5S rRNA maturation endonuclease (ribonuclease M5)